MKTSISTVGLFATLTGVAWAQSTFELPRECRERHGVDPEKCVIQDGPPADPWVRKKPLPPKPPQNGAPPPAAAPAPTGARVTR